MVHVPSHEGILCNELADRIANAAKEGHLISAVGPLRFSVSPEIHDEVKINAWLGVASQKDPKMSGSIIEVCMRRAVVDNTRHCQCLDDGRVCN